MKRSSSLVTRYSIEPKETKETVLHFLQGSLKAL